MLQVDPDATEDELKKQYRRLSILLHPDKNPDNRDQATSAFEVSPVGLAGAGLTEPEKETSLDSSINFH